MPALNFVAAASVVRHLGATPVFCDVVGEHDLEPRPRGPRGRGRAADPGDRGAALRRRAVRHGRRARRRRAARAGGDRGRRARAGCDVPRPRLRHARRRRLLQLLLQQEPADRRGRHGGDRRRGTGGPRPPPAVARHDRAELGSRARPRGRLRRAGERVQLPPRRGARRDRARPARPPRPRQRRPGPADGALPRAARRRRRPHGPVRPPSRRTRPRRNISPSLCCRGEPNGPRSARRSPSAGSRRASTTRRSTGSPPTEVRRGRCPARTTSPIGCSRCPCSRT